MPDDRRGLFPRSDRAPDRRHDAGDRRPFSCSSRASGKQEWSQIAAKAFKTRFERDGPGKIVGTGSTSPNRFEAEKKVESLQLQIGSGNQIERHRPVGLRRPRTGIISSPNQNAFLRDGLPIGTYLKLIHPEDANRFKEALQGMIERGDETIHHSNRINIQQEGGYRWADIHGVAFERDPNGRITKINRAAARYHRPEKT